MSISQELYYLVLSEGSEHVKELVIRSINRKHDMVVINGCIFPVVDAIQVVKEFTLLDTQTPHQEQILGVDNYGRVWFDSRQWQPLAKRPQK